MIRSMTGYGWSESSGYDYKCTAEIKAVNHRYCDVNIRMPAMMNPFEDQARKLLTEVLYRGKIDVYIRIESQNQESVKIDVNTVVADAYTRAVHELIERYSMPDRLTLDMLVKYPEVFKVDKSLTDEARQRIWTVLEKALFQALDQLKKMREAEGESLYTDIMAKRNCLADLLEGVKARGPEAVLEYEKRIRKRIEEVLAQIENDKQSAPVEADENRLMLELALYTERSCIDEEITRIESHLNQLGQIMQEGGPVGRKLDFLVQELHREVNTIGSKTGTIEISKLVIEMKSEIEKIREQVQNVE